jgi:hypothetical protein
MSIYESGDYVKVEFKDDLTGDSEWMWVQVDPVDDVTHVIFDRLDSQPILNHAGKLILGSQLAISFDNIREHRKARPSLDF